MSDASTVPAGFLTDTNAKGVPSSVECLRLDNGSKFTEPEVVEMLNQRGIPPRIHVLRFPEA